MNLLLIFIGAVVLTALVIYGAIAIYRDIHRDNSNE